MVEETLTSTLFKSNCPVTGQPDWASVTVRYFGMPIDHEGLLRYFISFRHHAEFHEQCVERIFQDVLQRCAPQCLAVEARYTAAVAWILILCVPRRRWHGRSRSFVIRVNSALLL